MRLVAEACGAEAAFLPARPLETINAYDILLAMRTGTGQELPMSELPELAEIYGEFARIEQAERNAAAGVTLLALANRMTPRAALEEPQPVAPAKTAATEPAPGKAVEPKPGKIAKPTPGPEEIQTPKPVTDENEPPRRKTVRPEEHTDFPL